MQQRADWHDRRLLPPRVEPRDPLPVTRDPIHMHLFLDDLRYAARTLSRSKGYAISVLIVLALGIGANTAIFSLVDAVLFRDLPVERPRELARIFAIAEDGTLRWSSSFPAYIDYREQARAFTGLAAYYDGASLHLSAGEGAPSRVSGALASGNFFQLLGVRAALGRVFSPDEDHVPGANPVVVLSDGLWRRRFGANPAVVGTSIRLNTRLFTVVGVAPAGFVGVNVERVPDIWMPLSMAETAMPEFQQFRPFDRRGFRWLALVGRLRHGSSIGEAQAQLATIAGRVVDTSGEGMNERPPRVVPVEAALIDPQRTADVSRLSWILLGVVGLVLIIACADAAGLLLARAERSGRELATRLAIGAPRARIIRQMLLESVLLSAGGAGLGLLLALWLSDFVVGAVPRDFALPLGAATPVLQLRSLVFTAVVAVGTAVVFTLLPAFRASDTSLAGILKGERRSVAVGRTRRVTARAFLVSQQVALSVVLVVGAGLLLRTLANASRLPLGFDPNGVTIASVDLSRGGYDREKGVRFYETLLAQLSAAPGFTSVALAASVPVQGGAFANSLEFEGYTPTPGETPTGDINIVTPGYFRTLGTPLVAGRDFTSADVRDGAMVIIINQALADRFFPGQNPLGKRLTNLGQDGAVVVGVVADAKEASLRDAPTPTVTVPLAQFYWSSMTVVARTSLDHTAASRTIARTVAGIDSDLPVLDPRRLGDNVGMALGQERLLAQLLAGFAALAVLLSTAGLYGVVAYTMQSRTREFGIRLALGAKARDVMGLVQLEAVMLAGAGLVVGLAGAYALSGFLRNLLYGVAPTDLLTYALTAVVLLLVALAAAYLPARRATKIDIVSTLRSE